MHATMIRVTPYKTIDQNKMMDKVSQSLILIIRVITESQQDRSNSMVGSDSLVRSHGDRFFPIKGQNEQK